MRKLSSVAPGWWDYPAFDDVILVDAARLEAVDLLAFCRLVRRYAAELERG